MASRLQEVRERAGLTQYQMAALLGVTRAAYAHWEQEIRMPPLHMALRVSAILGVPPEELFAGVLSRGIRSGRHAPKRVGRPKNARVPRYKLGDIGEEVSHGGAQAGDGGSAVVG